MNRAGVVLDLDDVLIGSVEILGCDWAEEGDIVPDDFRDRFREFLKPCVVREPAIEDGGVGPEDEFKIAG